jgi:CDP-6-deoxy-D-xylo-4-hexulose-3-dehydrase
MVLSVPLMKSTFLEEKKTKNVICDFIQKADKLSMGNEVINFEKSFGVWQGRNHTIMVNSGSSANLVLLQSLINLGRIAVGARVGVSAVTWATNVMPVIQLGLVPVLIDVNISTLNISPNVLKSSVIDVLFITHLLGFHDDIETITSYCSANNIVLLEDTCESLGTVCKYKRLGNFGLASTFSTFVGHHMSTIEGGMICTDDSELAMMVRMVRAHGWDRNIEPEERDRLRTTWNIDEFHGPYTFYTLGYNVRPTDIQGLIGSVQIQHVDSANETRKKSFSIFREIINKTKGVFTPDMDVPAFAVPVICETSDIRNQYIKKCKDKGIETRPVVAGSMNKQPFFQKYVNGQTPNADTVHDVGFYMPNHPDMTADDIDLLCSVFR